MKKITIFVLFLVCCFLYSQKQTIKKSSGAISSCSQSVPSNNFEDGAGDLILSRIADDLLVAPNVDFTATTLKVNIWHNGGFNDVVVGFYKDNFGFPGAQVGNFQTIVPTSSTVIGNKYGTDINEIVLDISPVLLEGTFGKSTVYWVSIETPNPITFGETAYWDATTIPGTDNVIVYNENNQGWNTLGFQSAVFNLSGNCEPKDPSIFPSPYCGPLDFPRSIVPITLVKVAGIDNRSSEILEGSASHENFTAITGQMQPGMTYPVILEGNTGGNFIDSYTVFVDWNRDGILDNAGERYDIGNISNSTGDDGIQATGSITVPTDATAGSTRMRVVKKYEVGFAPDACTPDSAYGQVEDYTVEVGVLSTNGNTLSEFSIYPNPTSGIVYLKSDIKIETAEIYNLTGQKLKTIKIVDNKADVSFLTKGIYILQVTADGQKQSIKMIKE